MDYQSIFKNISESLAEIENKGNLGIGFCGCHRTGKTTKMEKWNLEYPSKYITAKTTTKELIQKLHNNNDSMEKLPLVARLETQTLLLNNAYLTWKEFFIKARKENKTFITDRSPVDYLSYTYLIDFIKRDESTQESKELVKNIRDLCKEISQNMFSKYVYFPVKYFEYSISDSGYPFEAAPYRVEVLEETGSMKDSYRFVLDCIYNKLLSETFNI